MSGAVSIELKRQILYTGKSRYQKNVILMGYKDKLNTSNGLENGCLYYV